MEIKARRVGWGLEFLHRLKAYTFFFLFIAMLTLIKSLPADALLYIDGSEPEVGNEAPGGSRDQTQPLAKVVSLSLKSSAPHTDYYDAYTYGFHSFTEFGETTMSKSAEGYGYSPYGMATD